MSFNPGKGKQAQEVICSRKLKKTLQPPLLCNSNQVNKTSSKKLLGITLHQGLIQVGEGGWMGWLATPLSRKKNRESGFSSNFILN